MNTNIKYIVVFGLLAVLVSFFVSVGVGSSRKHMDNPNSYTVNTAHVTTANGHILSCTYKENIRFVYALGCIQEYGSEGDRR